MGTSMLRRFGTVAFVAFVVFALAPRNAAAQVVFEHLADMPWGDCPIGSVTGDFDEDGRGDVATTDFHMNELRLLLGDGSGSLSGAGTWATGGQPIHIATADFDLDGHLDIAVPNVYTNDISRFRGDGAGGFTPLASIAVGVQPRFIVVGDFDGNGVPDIAAPNRDSAFLSLLMGDGAGGFVRHDSVMPLGVEWAAVLDANEDGLDDLVVGNPASASLALLISDGVGGFSSSSTVSVIAGGFVAAADMDGDGHGDLVTYSSSGMLVFYGNGSGAFAIGDPFGALASNTTIVLGDFDHDGIADIVANSFGIGEVKVFQGLGGRRFELVTGPLPVVGPHTITAGDLTGDGLLDLVTTNVTDHKISVFLNRSSGSSCRSGNVNAAAGPLADVLFVNSSAGADFSRTVTMPAGGALTVDLSSPPSRTHSTYAIYILIGEPTRETATEQPFDIGTSCFATRLNGSLTTITLANTMGHEGQLGTPLVRRALPPTPARLVATPVNRPLTVTLQGYIRDNAAVSPAGVALTNAVLLRVE